MATPYQERKIRDPALNPGDQPYFDGAAAGKLMLKKWRDCGQHHHANSSRYHTANGASCIDGDSARSGCSPPQLDRIDGCVGNSALRNSARRRKDQRRGRQRYQLHRFDRERGDHL